jgi:lipopolysaccharide/colanic/teichoic acid biosynthesis glycosyltransferase
MLKFRTMRVDAESEGAQMASAQDSRRTVIGTFLRKYSVDELPQFFNVLKGDMSLVGPRPERPVFIAEFKQQIPKYHLRHKVKAGVTGWAQVNGLRGQTSIQKRIEYDLYYIENWSLLLDLKILLRTALGGFLSKNAY